jgi:hypothetical protein
MPSFQLLRCAVALAGDRDQVVVRDRFRPVVFPELLVLQHLHGEDAVTEVAVVGTWDASNDEVLDRLRVIYAETALKEVFPGTKPRLPSGDPSIPRCTRPIRVPPVTRPDNPDPILRPLADLTTGQDVPRVEYVPADPDHPDPFDPPGDSPLSQDQIEAEMSRMFGQQFPGPDETPPEPEFRGQSEAELVKQAIGTAMQGAIEKAEQVRRPDPQAAPRARDVGGRGTTAPRTADHAPDVAGGNVRQGSATRMNARENKG